MAHILPYVSICLFLLLSLFSIACLFSLSSLFSMSCLFLSPCLFVYLASLVVAFLSSNCGADPSIFFYNFFCLFIFVCLFTFVSLFIFDCRFVFFLFCLLVYLIFPGVDVGTRLGLSCRLIVARIHPSPRCAGAHQGFALGEQSELFLLGFLRLAALFAT